MADGVSARLQRDMAHQQQELERIEIKLDGGLAKLQTEIEKIGSEMRSMFEQIMNKDLWQDYRHSSGNHSSNQGWYKLFGSKRLSISNVSGISRH